jgi:hypothetical protein
MGIREGEQPVALKADGLARDIDEALAELLAGIRQP